MLQVIYSLLMLLMNVMEQDFFDDTTQDFDTERSIEDNRYEPVFVQDQNCETFITFKSGMLKQY
ncbi:hypothetical protein OOZ15_09805 [Galbibacter sp. EGI 63066]|uniref:hypothetical protein n=1 Tax=Galbibacter sp. EGI 63066 TaxID=2993559 RepID=UPI002248D494|nr:hypothetical protein [Galbibacter sp. EGI 63066]MCX2680232.1 hypothetical protein [Galbibacter sp. EGI 63066]